MRRLGAVYKLVVAALFGAQLFFAAVAAQRAFPPEVAALPRGDPRRTLAADLVGQMLGPLDAATLLGGALCVVICVLLFRAHGARVPTEPLPPGPEGALARQQAAASRASAVIALRAALPPLLAALCAVASAFGTTPAIHAMREAGRTGEARFGMLHGLSSGLLLLEMALLLLAALRPLEAGPPAPAPEPGA